jgi:predicted RNA binding protein YcfA (HicA-like mRNA interferase family)
LGATFIRQTSSHKQYKRITKAGLYVITIPQYPDIFGDVLHSIIRQTGVSKKEFWMAYYGDVPAKVIQELVVPTET